MAKLRVEDMTDQELLEYTRTVNDEVNRRKAERMKREAEERYKRNLELVPLLLQAVKHGRTSCSDEHPVNSLMDREHQPRCARCGLLEMQGDPSLLSEVELQMNLGFHFTSGE